MNNQTRMPVSGEPVTPQPLSLGDAERPAAWATLENCQSSYALRAMELRGARAVLPTAHPHIFQLGTCSPLWGLRVNGKDHRVTKACIGHAVGPTTTLLTVEGFSASVGQGDLRALADEVARELAQGGEGQDGGAQA